MRQAAPRRAGLRVPDAALAAGGAGGAADHGDPRPADLQRPDAPLRRAARRRGRAAASTTWTCCGASCERDDAVRGGPTAPLDDGRRVSVSGAARRAGVGSSDVMQTPWPPVTRTGKRRAEDGGHLIWPEPAPTPPRHHRQRPPPLRRPRHARAERAAARAAPRDCASGSATATTPAPLIATGHQTELYHPGVWVKNVLIHLAAEKLGGQAYHFAVDTDEPKHLSLRWPGGSVPLTDGPLAASWSGLLDAPSPEHVSRIEREFECRGGRVGFRAAGRRGFSASMRRLALEDEPKLAAGADEQPARAGLGAGAAAPRAACFRRCAGASRTSCSCTTCSRAPARSPRTTTRRSAAYRRANKVRTPGRPMPDLNASDDECEVPFWLDELATGARFRRVGGAHGRPLGAARAGRRATTSSSSTPRPTAGTRRRRLLAWLRRNDLRLSPRALTLTMLLRLLVADQFVHGIGGGRYDQVTDALIARHFDLEPPRFAVTTATLYFPGAAGRTRACMACVMQEGHRLRHNVLGDGEAAARRGHRRRPAAVAGAVDAVLRDARQARRRRRAAPGARAVGAPPRGGRGCASRRSGSSSTASCSTRSSPRTG